MMPTPQLAGHVRAGEHRLHAFDGERGGGVDTQHVGPGVVGEAHRGVQAALGDHVVDVGAEAAGQVGGLVADAPGADDAGLLQGGFLAVGQVLHGVEDLDVAGAAAEVAAEVARGLLTAQVGAPCGR